MSYPTFDGVVRVQVQMQGDSGLPEDVFINTWYFLEQFQTLSWEDATAQQAAWDFLDGYYGTVHAPATSSISQWISPRVTSVKYSMAPLYIAPPRYPIAEQVATWTATGSAPLLEEASVVSSFYGNDPLSQANNTPRARRRGRHFLGPLSASSLAPNGAPSGLLLNTIEAAGEWAVGQQDPSGVQWVVISPTQGTLVSTLSGTTPVAGGWVDNAWDTQRSRGLKPTVRQTFGVPIA